MRRPLASILLLASVLVAGLLAWRSGEQARLRRQADEAREAGARAQLERERLEAAASARPGEEPIERLRVEPAVLDFGDLLPDVQVTRKVLLRNIGDRPVKVTRATADCGCTIPTAPADPIPAGGVIEVEIGVRPGLTQGTRLSKRVTYEIEGALPAFCRVEGMVGSYIRCTPMILDAPAAGVELPPAEIELRSMTGIPFTVTEVEPSIESDGPTEPALRQLVHIDWRLWREAGRPLQVTISTDHSGAPAIPIVIRRHDEP